MELDNKEFLDNNKEFLDNNRDIAALIQIIEQWSFV